MQYFVFIRNFVVFNQKTNKVNTTVRADKTYTGSGIVNNHIVIFLV